MGFANLPITFALWKREEQVANRLLLIVFQENNFIKNLQG
jgi:hypothetical protein